MRDGGWGWGAVFFDYDNDGDLDLAMTNGFDSDRTDSETPFHTDPTKLWRNEGDGTFIDVSLWEGITDTGSGKGLLVFDYDNDGDLDLFIVNNAGVPVLYRNDLANSNHWLRVKPRGRYSNRDAIGALVTVSSGGREQSREINGGSHFLTQSEKVAHFGLGASAAVADLVTVRWPSGIEQQFADVAVDQVLEVTEPANPYEAWLTENFTQAERSAGVLTDPLADPDGDRLSNALEFGCGLDPRRGENIAPIAFSRDPSTGEMTVRYRRRSLPRGVDVTVEKTADLANWQVCEDGDLEILSVQERDGWGVEVVSARLREAPGDGSRSEHLRLRVTVSD